MASRLVLLIFLLSLILTPFAGLAPLMILGLILGVFSIGESIFRILFSEPDRALTHQEVEVRDDLH